MTTVPKLSYTSLKSKNRIKEEANDELRLSNQSSDLFAHMNKDNLAYIQGQIKEKRKKNTATSKQIKANEEPKKQEGQLGEDDYPETPELLSPDISSLQPVTKTEGQNNAFFSAEMGIELDMKRKFSYVEPEYQSKKEQNPSLKPKAILMNLETLEHKSKQNISDDKNSRDNFLNFLQTYIHDLNTEKSHRQTKRNTQQSQQFKKKDQLRGANRFSHVPIHNISYDKSSDRFSNSQRIANLESQVTLLYQELVSVKGLLFSEQSPQQVFFRSPINKEREQSRSFSALGQQSYKMQNGPKSRRNDGKRDDRSRKNAIEELRLVQEQYEDFLNRGTVKLKNDYYM